MKFLSLLLGAAFFAAGCHSNEVLVRDRYEGYLNESFPDAEAAFHQEGNRVTPRWEKVGEVTLNHSAQEGARL